MSKTCLIDIQFPLQFPQNAKVVGALPHDAYSSADSVSGASATCDELSFSDKSPCESEVDIIGDINLSLLLFDDEEAAVNTIFPPSTVDGPMNDIFITEEERILNNKVSELSLGNYNIVFHTLFIQFGLIAFMMNVVI